MLARLGFELVHGDQRGGPGGSVLLVALRSLPTYQHFDPERVDYWVTADGRGRVASLDRRHEVPYEAEFAWGTITVVDRLEVSNTFLTFGGHLAAQALDEASSYVILGSPAPILRWTGHSQDIDPLAAEVKAFFARMMVPIDFTPGAEAIVGRAAPLTIYAACLREMRERFAHSAALRDTRSSLFAQVLSESRRVESLAPADWEAAVAFRKELGLP
jgi:hypothetical protein